MRLMACVFRWGAPPVVTIRGWAGLPPYSGSFGEVLQHGGRGVARVSCGYFKQPRADAPVRFELFTNEVVPKLACLGMQAKSDVSLPTGAAVA